MLNLEPAFVLDETAVHAAYVKLQQEAHPDRQTGKSDAERQKAALLSAAANDAYRVLKDEYLRACHLLELQGMKVHGDKAEIKPAPDLLMEVMEWNEQVEEAAGTQAATLLGKLETEQERLVEALTESFAAEHYEQAAQQTLRLNYLEKIIRILTRKVKGMAA